MSVQQGEHEPILPKEEKGVKITIERSSCLLS